jgi:hypothetical protein
LEVRRLSKQDKSPTLPQLNIQYLNEKINNSEDNRLIKPRNSSKFEASTLSTSISKSSVSRSGENKKVVKHHASREPTYSQSSMMNRRQIGKDFEFRNTFDYPTCKYNDYSSPQHFNMESHRVSF